MPDPSSHASASLTSMTARSDRSLREILLIVLLFGVGIGSWALLLQPPLKVDPTPLDSLPYRFDGWQGTEIGLDETVTKMLRADQNVMRSYTQPTGALVWLYIGYYGTKRGGRPEHTPEVCYPSAGWAVQRAQPVTIDPASGLTADEFVAERGGHRQLVQFWYRSSRRSGIHGGFRAISDRLLNRVFHGRADGALIRISTPIGEDGIPPARERLGAFAMSLERLLRAHWPREFVPGPASA